MFSKRANISIKLKGKLFIMLLSTQERKRTILLVIDKNIRVF